MSITFLNGKPFQRFFIVLTLVSLAACGGGGGSKKTGSVLASSLSSGTVNLSSKAAISSLGSNASASSIAGSSLSTTSLSTTSLSTTSLSSKSSSSASSVVPLSFQMGGAIQGSPLNLTTEVTTLAGRAAPADGTGLEARFLHPTQGVSDGTHLYVIEDTVIRKIAIATGVVTTFAGKAGVTGKDDGIGGEARFTSLKGITIAGDFLYVTDGNATRRIDKGTAEVIAWSGRADLSGSIDGDTRFQTRFNSPTGITSDGLNLYVCDTGNNTIRQTVLATGKTTTIAGEVGIANTRDGIGTEGHFKSPYGIAFVGGLFPKLYVTDNLDNIIRLIVIPSKSVSTLAGLAGVVGSFDSDLDFQVSFNGPTGITLLNGDLFVADSKNHSIRRVKTADGATVTFAGKSGVAGNINATQTLSARFNSPEGVISLNDTFFVVDTGNFRIRKFGTNGTQVTSLAGNNLSADGTGAAANFSLASNVTTDGTNLYIAETQASIIRKVAIETGAVTTLAGLYGVKGSADGVGAAARFDEPTGITTDGPNLYVTEIKSNTIRKVVINTGEVITFAGAANTSGSTDGIGTAARFQRADGITTDGTNLYVVDFKNRIRKILISSGAVSTLTQPIATTDIRAITTDGKRLYLADQNRILGMETNSTNNSFVIGAATTTGFVDGAPSIARFSGPKGLSTDGTFLYVSDSANRAIRKIELATGTVITLAGSPTLPTNAPASDGTGTAVSFDLPSGITNDRFNLYLIDSRGETSTVRKMH